MIISTEIKKPLYSFIEHVENTIEGNVQTAFTFHGTSANLDTPFFISDIDVEYWMRYYNTLESKKALFEEYKRVFTILMKKMIFVKMLAGVDQRFVFTHRIRKNGEVQDYDASIIRKRFQTLYKDKVVTKKELDELLHYVVEKPNMVQFMNLANYIDTYKNIQSESNEIQVGKKIYRGKTFTLFDIFIEDAFKTTFVYEILKHKYVLFELVFHICSLPSHIPNIRVSRKKQYTFLTSNATLYGEKPRNSTYYFYETIFRNYVKGNYFKVIKRIRSLLGEAYFQPNAINTIDDELNRELKNPKHRTLLYEVRAEIQLFTKSSNLPCFNQLKNRLEILLLIFNTISTKKYKIFLEELYKDMKKRCGYTSKSIQKIQNKKDIETLYKEISDHMNTMAKPYLIRFSDILQNVLPYKDLLKIHHHTNTMIPSSK